MKLTEFQPKTIVILGLGLEGRSTWRYLRSAFPEKTLAVADRLPLDKMPAETAHMINADSWIRLHLGEDYLSSLAEYDVIIKSPGISVKLPEYRRALAAGKEITSQTALFFANFPGTIFGVTGTKGKSTTASLLHAILKKAFPDTRLMGNIGVPPLDILQELDPGTKVVYELSSHQLEGLRQSPQVAILLNIVPEHLDYYDSFEHYADAKENITRFQNSQDFLVYDADHDLPNQIAGRSRAQEIACSISEQPRRTGANCFLAEGAIYYRSSTGQEERVIGASEVPLLGRFNLINVAAAIAAGKVAGAATEEIAEAVRNFKPLEHRLERVGIFGSVTFYNDSIATVPEAAIAAIDTLGNDVETIMLGGTDRGLDFTDLARRLLDSGVKTLILFAPTGERIWKSVNEAAGAGSVLPQHFFVDSMEQAVEIAQRRTGKGKICLLSPASPSFGLFRDYRERGEAFKRLAREAR